MIRKLMMNHLKSNTMASRDTDRRRGSITMEAAIFLTLFVMFYVGLMDLIQIAKAQVILQHSINQVAKEVSAYSYVLTKAGIVEKRLETSKRANEFKDKVGEMVDAVKTVSETLSGGNAIEAIGAAQTAGGIVQEYAGEVDELPQRMLELVKQVGPDLLKQAGADLVSNLVIQEIVKSELRKQIEMASGKDADQFLRDLGIQDGFAGLNFSESNWCGSESGGMPELEVVVIYTIDYNLGYLKLQPRTFKLCAKTALW